MIIKLGELLGRGSYGNVYHALNPDNDKPLTIAIKKSRVSQRIQRPYLHHEAQVLRFLQGHPAIPLVIAYGHLKHFEYLALELLGKTLTEWMPEQGIGERTVARIAVDLISALEFVHSHGLIHRDIKPSNVLLSLDQPPTLRLIDFGIARPFRTGIPSRHDPVKDRQNVPGTLHWASLNAHFGYDTSRRDDLESLAYTLLFLLRGELPWQRYKGCSGTLFGYMKQVKEKKMRWSGLRLGEGFAGEFGELLDYARGLGFEEKPNYEMLRKGFERLAGNQVEAFDFPSSFATMSMIPPPSHPKQPSPSPVALGQLIYVKLLSRFSIEGYTAQNSDLSYWDDPSLLRPEWETKIRPAVVLGMKLLNGDKYWRVKVLPLRRNTVDTKVAEDGTVISVSPQSSRSGSASERWPWEETVAFAFPHAETFLCLPDQPVLTPARWSLLPSDCAALSQRFDRRLSSSSTSADEQLKIRIQNKTDQMYAALFPLDDPCSDAVASDNIEWYGPRGWLDEMAQAARKRVFEQGGAWSTPQRMAAVAERGKDEAEIAPRDSNTDPYLAEWSRLGGREVSITLDGIRGVGHSLDQSIERIDRVVRDD